jgi:hypothetical protein
MEYLNGFFQSRELLVHKSSILGGSSLYITGVTILDNRVEPIKLPINTIANGEIRGFVEIAIGIRPVQ